MIILLVTAFSLKAQVTEEEFQALKAFYNATGGDHWTDRTGWENINTTATKDDVTTSWKGILWIDEGHVTELNFYDNNLTGTLPSEIGGLKHLNSLALNYNDMSGPLPSTLKQLTMMKIFAMAGNNLNIPFPSEFIESWPDLLVLDLNRCGITGTVPDIFDKVPNLNDLEIFGNNLEGELPPSLNNLNLHEFHCDNNKLDGSLPQLTNTTDIYRLSFSNNNFTGTIPEHYGDFVLQYFQIDYNQLFGAIPEKLFATPIYLLTIQGNYFTFADIEPVFGKINESENKYYAPAKNLPLLDDAVSVNEGQTLTLDASALSVYGLGGSNNLYKWFYNNAEVYSGSSPVYSVPFVEMANAGTYRFEVTNSVVTDLTLKSQNLVVTVKKGNHNPTDITLSKTTVVENFEGLVGAFSAVDPDEGDTHTFSLIQGDGTTDKDNSLFTITGNQLFLNNSVDYESVKTLNINVAVNDGKGGLMTKAFTIEVTNENEAPRFLGQVTNASIDENAPNGAYVFSITVSDPENDALIYSIKQGDENGAFKIVDRTLVVADGSKLDYETKNEYFLVVTVSDGKLSLDISITVTLNNVIEYYVITAGREPQEGGTVSNLSASYLSGDPVTVVATPATGYEFVNWTEDGTEVSTSANYTFVVTSDRNLVANFRQKVVNVTLWLSAKPAESGTVSGEGTVPLGSSVTAIATPATGYEFVNWTDDGVEVSTSANYTFIVTSDLELVANFRQKVVNVTLSLSANPAAGGTVSGAGAVLKDSSVTAIATPASGYEFVNWTDDGVEVSTSANYTFVVTSDRNLVANFRQKVVNVTLWLSAKPAESGTVSGAGTVLKGSSVTAIATPASGYEFVNWTENGTEVSTSANYTFVVASDRNLVANFKLKEVNVALSLSANPATGGTISGAGTVLKGSSVTAIATPASGYEFVNWTEDGTEVSTSANYTFVVTSDRNLVANFKQKVVNVILSLSANPATGGTISGAGTVLKGSSVTAIATPASGYEFVNWTENGTEVSASANYTFVVTSDRNLVANFKLKVVNVTLSLSANPTAGGTVSGAGTVLKGSSVTAIATPASGYEFVNWTENGTEVSASANYTFVVHSDRNLTANFQQTTGITEQEYPAVNVFPNPATSYFVVDGIKAGSEIIMTTLSGAVVNHQMAGSGVTRIDIGKYRKGVYFVIVQNNNQKIVRKLVIE